MFSESHLKSAYVPPKQQISESKTKKKKEKRRRHAAMWYLASCQQRDSLWSSLWLTLDSGGPDRTAAGSLSGLSVGSGNVFNLRPAQLLSAVKPFSSVVSGRAPCRPHSLQFCFFGFFFYQKQWRSKFLKTHSSEVDSWLVLTSLSRAKGSQWKFWELNWSELGLKPLHRCYELPDDTQNISLKVRAMGFPQSFSHNVRRF